MSVIRRISEDARFRPFMTTHFDAEGYISSVIKEGRSEEVFADLETCIAEVNEEIKGYISLHKHDLMSGMQDVAVLATRYQALQSLSSRVRASVDRLKKETIGTHDLVESRTMELENIHTTGIILRQLRQFAHALGQLEHYVNDSSNVANNKKDIRQYTSAAKILHELEQLISITELQSIDIVAEHAASIRTFGKQLREASKERLLAGLKDRNQAVVADCLQIFFNLNSLPEIVLLAIDTAVRSTSDVSGASIDLDMLVSISNELAAPDLTSEKSSPTRVGMRSSSSSSALSAPPSSGRKGSQDTSTTARQTSQLRVAMRELSHLWSSKLFEQALQIHVLQRVVAKKEDPSTHVRFVDVLRSSDCGGLASSLSSGNLMDLFYSRLVVSLQDVVNEKIKSFPLAAARVYPSLRKAAADVTYELKTMAEKHSGSVEDVIMSIFSGADSSVDKTGSRRSNTCFGSLSWTLEDSTIGQLSNLVTNYRVDDNTQRRNHHSLSYSCYQFPGCDDMSQASAVKALLTDWPGIGGHTTLNNPENASNGQEKAEESGPADIAGAVLTQSLQVPCISVHIVSFSLTSFM